jgi:hypothetical protein
MEQLAETCRQSGKLLETVGRTRKTIAGKAVTGNAGKGLNSGKMSNHHSL